MSDQKKQVPVFTMLKNNPSWAAIVEAATKKIQDEKDQFWNADDGDAEVTKQRVKAMSDLWDHVLAFIDNHVAAEQRKRGN